MTQHPLPSRILRRAIGYVREAVAPLGRPGALSWRVVMVFLPFVSLSQFVTDSGTTGTSRRLWLAATGAGAVVFLLIFAITKLLLRGPTHRPLLVVLVFAVAGTARTLTNGVVATFLGLDPSPEVAAALGLGPARELTYRLVGGAVLTPALMAVIAVAVSRHDAHRSVLNELRHERDRLLELGQSTDAALARTEAELTVAVRAAIEPAIETLDGVLDRVVATSATKPAVDALAHLVDDEVRPISHRLAGTERWTPVNLDHPRHVQRIRLPLPHRLALGDGFRPVLMGFLFVAVAAPTALRHAPPGTVTLHLAGALLVCGFTARAMQFAVGWVKLPTFWAVAAVAALHAVGAAVIVQVFRGAWLSIDPGTRLSGIPVAAVAGAATTLAAAVDARRSATEAELAGVVNELRALIEVIDRRARLVRARLAHVLHGSLQGALHAAAIRLAESPNPDAALIRGIRSDIAAAIERIDDRGAGGASLQRTLDELVAVWSGTRAITVAVPAEVMAAVVEDADADGAAAEVVREAVNNAMRHGGSRNVEIDVRFDDAGPGAAARRYRRHLRIVVSDDGCGWAPDSSRGLGSFLLDELCAAWRHDDTGPGTRVTAWVGVTPLRRDKSVG